MSWQATAWALGVKTGRPSAKCVLLCLANYADENGVCWPAQERIARETEQSIRSVQRRISELEGRGLLNRKVHFPEAGNGRGRLADLYILAMRPTGQSVALVEQGDNPDRLTRHCCQPSIEEPSRTISKKPERKSAESTKRASEEERRKLSGQRQARSVQAYLQLAYDVGDGDRMAGVTILAALPASELECAIARRKSGELDISAITKLRMPAALGPSPNLNVCGRQRAEGFPVNLEKSTVDEVDSSRPRHRGAQNG